MGEHPLIPPASKCELTVPHGPDNPPCRKCLWKQIDRLVIWTAGAYGVTTNVALDLLREVIGGPQDG